MFWKALLFALLFVSHTVFSYEEGLEYSYSYRAEYSASAHRIGNYGDLCLKDISLKHRVCRYFRDEYRNMLERLDATPDYLIKQSSDPLVEWENIYNVLQYQSRVLKNF